MQKVVVLEMGESSLQVTCRRWHRWSDSHPQDLDIDSQVG